MCIARLTRMHMDTRSALNQNRERSRRFQSEKSWSLLQRLDERAEANRPDARLDSVFERIARDAPAGQVERKHR